MAKHISVRVPWHDKFWQGTVCSNPKINNDCLKLKNIGEKSRECIQHAGQICDEDFLPACFKENGLFLSEEPYDFISEHPYTFHRGFRHLNQTQVTRPINSFFAIPFRWFRKPTEEDPNPLHDMFYTGYNPDLELVNFNWISNGQNVRNTLEYFWKDVIKNESFVIPYVKSSPLTETSGRIVVALSRIKEISDIQEYKYNIEEVDDNQKMFLWERFVTHALHGGDSEGFVFPFEQIQDYLGKHPEKDPDDFLLIVPSEYHENFSYVTEHVSYEGMLVVFNKAKELLQKYRGLGFIAPEGKNWDDLINWCDQSLRQIWLERGMYPGLGNVLEGLGVPYGNDIFRELENRYKQEGQKDDLFAYVLDSFIDIQNLQERLPNYIHPILQNVTENDIQDCHKILESYEEFWRIIARVNVNSDTVIFLYQSLYGEIDEYDSYRYLSSIPDLGENFAEQVINNPYILYEQTRLLPQNYRVSLNNIDFAFFPPKTVDLFPNHDNPFKYPDDSRRLRALITMILEDASINDGHTMLFVRNVLELVNLYRSDVPGVNIDLHIKKITLQKNQDFYAEMFNWHNVETINGANMNIQDNQALKLTRFVKLDEVIRNFVNDRLQQEDYPLPNDESWLDETQEDRENFEANIAQYSDEIQKQLREKHRRVLDEQSEALKKIYVSHLSVLTGGAGTGKTHVLVRLCAEQNVQNGGILILAPTGKARNVLQARLRDKGIKAQALTVASFHYQHKHFLIETYFPYLTDNAWDNPPQTVIIDESSMLTEEDFGVLCELLANAERVVFSGDADQLPPIGAGKPFFELCEKLKKEPKQPHYARLRISNRQRGARTQRGVDEQLADFFTTDGSSTDVETLINTIKNEESSPVRFFHCDKPQNLADILKKVMDEVFNMTVPQEFANSDPRTRFDLSLGGRITEGTVNYYMNFEDPLGVEKWQILSPYRSREFVGTHNINQLIHETYAIPEDRGDQIRKQLITPYGLQEIIKGEKIINLVNRTFDGNQVWNIGNINGQEFATANGEIGILSRYSKNQYSKKNQYYILFSSQPGLLYRYYQSSEDAPLELAYALTVHKAQGSGFGVTILVLVNNGYSSFISREMIYTALTRHRDKLLVVTNMEPIELLNGASIENSAIAKRLTSTFEQTSFIRTDEKTNVWYDERLIHRASNGKLVRSKSELIIYNMMLDAGLQVDYEKRLRISDKEILPDFTITCENKKIVYWEHLGMLGNKDYCKRWTEKKKLYKNGNISEKNGNLFVTWDDPLNGSIDSREIKEKIEKIKCKR